jgi:predicted phosphodiesterase
MFPGCEHDSRFGPGNSVADFASGRMRKSLMLSLVALTLWSSGAAPAQADPPTLNLAQLSDIHDGGYHYSERDTNIAITDALRGNPQGLILTGDFNDNSHDRDHFYERLHEGIPKVLARLKDYSGPLFIALGNDDFGLNYQSDPEVLKKTYAEFRRDFGQRYYLDELGDGVSPNRLGGVAFITLNSVIFHPANRCPSAPAQAAQVLDFLQQALDQEAPIRTPIAVLLHIPPAVDGYNNRSSWKPEYVQRFLKILRSYPGQVVILSGHYHRNQVYRIARKQGDVPVLAGGALANKYGYSPNWRDYRWQMSRDAHHIESINYTIHYPMHPEWTSPYHLEPEHIAHWLDRILSNGATALRYFQDIFGHHDLANREARNRDDRQRIKDQFNIN